MQKRAIKARIKGKKASKREERGGPITGPVANVRQVPKAGTVAMRIDFGRHRELLEAIVKLAGEEMRPLDIQIIYMLKSCLKRAEAVL